MEWETRGVGEEEREKRGVGTEKIESREKRNTQRKEALVRKNAKCVNEWRRDEERDTARHERGTVRHVREAPTNTAPVVLSE